MAKLAIAFGVIGIGLSLWLVTLLVAGSPWATFSEQGALMMDMIWGRISLIDLYAGFFLALALVWLLERSLWVKILVTLTLPTLGNPVLAGWLVWRFKELKRRA